MTRPFLAPAAALAAALALPLALLAAVPASAASVTVMTWVDLQTAFAVDGDTVVLGADITAPANENLTVDPGETMVLDLHGHTLAIADPGPTLAAIEVADGTELTINATGGGTLTATGGNSSAGIGSEWGASAGTITINGGTINATGGADAAGIGGGNLGDGGTITINGGDISAQGGARAAGIGGGGGDFADLGTITITINDGDVTAIGGDLGAGIGGGNLGGTITITINDGDISAQGGALAAGIGGGQAGAGGTIAINGGVLSARGGSNGAGIGGGGVGSNGAGGGNAGDVTITGGDVTATGTNGGPGIGSGAGFAGDIVTGSIVLTGGTIAATGGTNGAGIGGGDNTTWAGFLDIQGTPDAGAATDGGDPHAATITNSVEPAGVGYSAVTATVSSGGQIIVGFHYLVTFDAAGGSGPSSVTVNDGDTLTALTDPSRDGYAFDGWTLGGSAYDFATAVTGPITLTATWARVLAATGVGAEFSLGGAGILVLGSVLLIAARRRATA